MIKTTPFEMVFIIRVYMEDTLGKRIAFHRKRLGLTQDKLYTGLAR